ncbi:hypothetical protein B296_00008447 [Ensete ventricosum]|uniref:Uncharacterized protein n=1 Tax=Ensete ventricosum TaxID=4639 RepID=A0A426Z8A4_ENSVE|nr:hypothetical protein B296_00008447 [Ensete ventricosum]
MAPSSDRLGMIMNTSSSAYKPLHEYRVLRVNNSSHLCELCTALSIVAQHIPLCTVSSFTKRPALLEHCQVWLPTSSHNSNSTIPTFALHILSSLLVLVVPLAQKVGHSSECQSWMLAPLSDSFPYISMSVSPKRSRVLAALYAAQLGPSHLHSKCFCMCLSRSDIIYHELSWFCLSRAAPLHVRPRRSASPKPPRVP